MSGSGRPGGSDDREWRIDRARREDLGSLPDIERLAGDQFRAWPATAALPLYLTPAEDFVRAQRAGLLWVARIGAMPIGFALAEALGEGLHLEELDVLPRHAGRGVGRRLVEAVCQHAQAGGQALTLCTFRDVPWNAPWYARLGFREIPPERLGPALAARVAEEAAHGLPPALRLVMRFEP